MMYLALLFLLAAPHSHFGGKLFLARQLNKFGFLKNPPKLRIPQTTSTVVVGRSIFSYDGYDPGSLFALVSQKKVHTYLALNKNTIQEEVGLFLNKVLKNHLFLSSRPQHRPAPRPAVLVSQSLIRELTNLLCSF